MIRLRIGTSCCARMLHPSRLTYCEETCRDLLVFVHKYLIVANSVWTKYQKKYLTFVFPEWLASWTGNHEVAVLILYTSIVNIFLVNLMKHGVQPAS